MTLPLLIVLAVAVPFVVFGVLWLMAKHVMWLGPRPRARGLFFLALGLVYFPWAIWELLRDGVGLGTVSFLIGGIAWILLGVHELRRGEVQSFD